MTFQYEELLLHLRNWDNRGNEPGQYDGNGLVHLMLAILDNLRQNEAWADLPEIRDSMTDEQAAFFLKLASYVGDCTPRSGWPSFGELLDYLCSLGFKVHNPRPGLIWCEHPEEGSTFAFREQDCGTPAREIELLNVQIQLTHRGIVTEQEYARFWNQRIRLTS
jgi:hypothetical protein